MHIAHHRWLATWLSSILRLAALVIFFVAIARCVADVRAADDARSASGEVARSGSAPGFAGFLSAVN